MLVCAGISAQTTEEIWGAINSYRVEYGLPALRRSSRLDVYCRWYLDVALEAESFTHDVASRDAKSQKLGSLVGPGLQYHELLAWMEGHHHSRMFVAVWDHSPSHHWALFDWTGAEVAGLATARNSKGQLRAVLLIGGG